jgi:hypothetical protein
MPGLEALCSAFCTSLSILHADRQQLSPVLRFFYIQTLKRPSSIADTPYPKKRYRLPTILSQEEVAQLIDAAHRLPSIALF